MHTHTKKVTQDIRDFFFLFIILPSFFSKEKIGNLKIIILFKLYTLLYFMAAGLGEATRKIF